MMHLQTGSGLPNSDRMVGLASLPSLQHRSIIAALEMHLKHGARPRPILRGDIFCSSATRYTFT